MSKIKPEICGDLLIESVQIAADNKLESSYQTRAKILPHGQDYFLLYNLHAEDTEDSGENKYSIKLLGNEKEVVVKAYGGLTYTISFAPAKTSTFFLNLIFDKIPVTCETKELSFTSFSKDKIELRIVFDLQYQEQEELRNILKLKFVADNADEDRDQNT